ncbi:MAG TPA: hypothetical protein VH040_03265 [Usitatibacter sp.]|jgi:hypothetical protein|nr:hypothetical protein [Usitatibacter sp.]
MNKKRHIHLGERLGTIEAIRERRLTAEQAAASFELPVEEIHAWMQMHSGDRIFTLDEARVSPEALRLSKRAERLVELIAAADLTIRVLNRMLTESATPREA